MFPEEVDVAINGILPVAYATKSLVMQPIAQCLNDAKPYKEGAGTFKLPVNNSTTGGNTTTGAGTALTVRGAQAVMMAGATTFFLVTGL